MSLELNARICATQLKPAAPLVAAASGNLRAALVMLKLGMGAREAGSRLKQAGGELGMALRESQKN